MHRTGTAIGLPLAFALVGATAAGTAVAAAPGAPVLAAAELAASPAAGATTGSPTLPYREGPPPAHTGGFGEPTCAECHFGGPINTDPGTLTVELPEIYEPGRTYRLSVVLAHPEMAVAGFQLAVRFAGGLREGEQAGTLRSVGPRTTVTADTSSGVEYGHQTPIGTALSGAGQARWVLEWTAPPVAGDVGVAVAANAANDDASEFGDHVYTAARRVAASPGASVAPSRAPGTPAASRTPAAAGTPAAPRTSTAEGDQPPAR